ncbi:FMN-binding negative transcriptional regulator [Bacillus sp. S70]|uniref:FMN-binding negative transcriptional regulator n=1 Tax=unclassified Bacillus (in: firmicutes) TaxID=185979 RepID=UPI00190A3B6D|nr:MULTISPECIES: FMN-binding negative transcriptional regulator [unclassified Bacillus (in: firmicutes)]MBJ9980130.1 FMN-binding negative transcriptional regulator [Bacillus sp. S29]MBK0101594.1 FMN-binding negative transcriptional regulator [Bacillus sp. S70]MBK0106611.1 FMN-binding negative transcriptional regulator [Bacillus sp. S73]MBK0134757.1 FMN-binding negative transcriptional regulator [Bacillus sp. S72]MBK0147893.1 FMN-binding negative transcriptional regulator [Bacillus sp. S74]
MYIPKYFAIQDEEMKYEIMEQNSFATLFSQHNGELYATHLPLLLNRETLTLHGHFARPNEQWKDIGTQQVLAIFQGPHSYISPSWYETNNAVPTWNYVAVHVYGELEIVEDEKTLVDSLQDLVNKYENPESTYSLNDVDPNYMGGLSKGIVGFKIKINKIEGKAKLSQNHSVERRNLVVEKLEKVGSEESKRIAELMRK